MDVLFSAYNGLCIGVKSTKIKAKFTCRNQRFDPARLRLLLIFTCYFNQSTSTIPIGSHDAVPILWRKRNWFCKQSMRRGRGRNTIILEQWTLQNEPISLSLSQCIFLSVNCTVCPIEGRIFPESSWILSPCKLGWKHEHKMEIPLYKSNTIIVHEQRKVERQDHKRGESTREKERQYILLGKEEEKWW